MNKINPIKTFVALITLVVISASCTKSLSENDKIDKSQPPVVILQCLVGNSTGLNVFQIFDKLKNETDAAFIISTQSSHISGYHYGSFQGEYKNDAVSEAGVASVNSFTLPTTYTNGYHYINHTGLNEVFGTTVNFSLPFNNVGTNYALNKSFSLPQKINLQHDGNIGNNFPTIQNATAITWTPDEKNKDNYVMISIEYNPKSFLNGLSEGNRVSKTIILNDSEGGYTFTSENLNNIPNNAIIDVHVYRGRFEFHTESGKEFFLSAYSLQFFTERCVK